MELVPLQRDAEPLIHPYYDASGDKINQHKINQMHIQKGQNMPISFKERFTGWRRSLLLGCVMCVIVLCFNLGFTVLAVQRHHVQDDQGVLYEGDCDTVRNASIGFHLVINIFSTALLGASNYCMVCLKCPFPFR